MVWHLSLQNLEKSEKEESLPPAEEPECLSEVSEQVPLPITIPDVNAASEFLKQNQRSLLNLLEYLQATC
jgi:hypothetical protein